MFKFLAIVLAFVALNVSASERFSFSFGASTPSPVCVTVAETVVVRSGYWSETYAPATYSVSYVNGVRYETLVLPARTERFWVQPVYETRYIQRPVVVYARDRYYAPRYQPHYCPPVIHFGYRGR